MLALHDQQRRIPSKSDYMPTCFRYLPLSKYRVTLLRCLRFANTRFNDELGRYTRSKLVFSAYNDAGDVFLPPLDSEDRSI
jgi:hypothetical protein